MEKSSCDPYDLPVEFRESGWRKCFSSREKRYYYYNKFTQQSIWSLYELQQQFSHETTKRDPLGLCTPTSLKSTHRLSLNSDNVSILSSSTPMSDLSYHSTKIISQYDCDQFDYNNPTAFSSPASIPSPKRIALSPPLWDFKYESNVITYERPMNMILPPHEDIELSRTKSYQKLCDTFQILLQDFVKNFIDELGILNKPNEIQHLFTILVIEFVFLKYDDNVEPLLIKFINMLEKRDESFLIHYLLKIIKNNINKKLIQNDENKEELMNTIIELYRKIITNLIDSPESEELNGNQVTSNKQLNLFEKSISSWLRWTKSLKTDTKPTTDNKNKEDDLITLRKKCETHLSEVLELKLKKMIDSYNVTCETIVAELNEECTKLYADHNVEIMKAAPEYKRNRKVVDYPLLICTPSLPLPIPHLEHDTYNSSTYLTYNHEKFSIKTNYFVKLEQLYKINSKDDEHLHLFLGRVWCLLKRYQIFNDETIENETLLSDETSDQINLKSIIDYQLYALNQNVIGTLARLFHVRFEIFSNPFTCYFKQFCSLFDDTDSYFGSRGSFLRYKAISGSFLATIPHSISLINRFMAYINSLLGDSTEQLMFVIVLPLIKFDKAFVDKITTNQYCKRYFKLQKNLVGFRRFSEYKLSNSDEIAFKCEYETLFAFYQNKEAEIKWPIVDYNIDELEEELKKSSSNPLSFSPYAE